MICQKCNEKMLCLFISYVCERCNPASGGNKDNASLNPPKTGWIPTSLPMNLTIGCYSEVYRSEEDARLSCPWAKDYLQVICSDSVEYSEIRQDDVETYLILAMGIPPTDSTIALA